MRFCVPSASAPSGHEISVSAPYLAFHSSLTADRYSVKTKVEPEPSLRCRTLILRSGSVRSGFARLDRRIGPRLDLAQIDVGQKRPRQAKASRADAVEIDDDGDGAHHDRKLLAAGFPEVGGIDRRIRRGKVHVRLVETQDAGERADDFIINLPIGRDIVAAIGAGALVGRRPFADDRGG